MSASALPAGSEQLLRELAPRVLGALARRCGDFAAAEDALQEALLAAVAQWPVNGLPSNPAGWLFQVAQRCYAEARRSARSRAEREAARARESPLALQDEPVLDEGELEHVDDTLALYFTCCHPAVPKPGAIALTLRAVGGLTTAEIASAFLLPESTLAQRIVRAKQAIRESGEAFALPAPDQLAARLASVLQVLYLIFNEGYAASSGAALMRLELASEAIRIARALLRVAPEPEVAGLLALMLLTDARRAARSGPAGELIPLDEQDRSLWDRKQIAEGRALVNAALAQGAPGGYQVQAAIAALHGEAASAESTDWAGILALYALLRRMSDNPMHALNQAVAAAMVHGPVEGLRRVDELARDPRIAGHYRLDAVRAHLHERCGDRAAAARHFLAAARGTSSLPERDFLLAKAARNSGP
jgi:predicted RNA polymerase sigma factor